VILGAGATRGASLVDQLSGPLPPLDADFFTQSQRVSKDQSVQHLKALVKSTVELFGPNFDLTLENLFTQIEHLSNAFDDYKYARVGRPRRNPYPAIRTELLQVLYAVLDESIGHDPDCRYHKNLIASLGAEDTILTFNYDWLLDFILKKYGRSIWNPKIGYGIPTFVNGKKGRNTEYWACVNPDTKDPTYPSKSIRVLKLHGSKNWFPYSGNAQKPKIHLRKRWWAQHGNIDCEIIPPEWNKPVRSGIYRHLWQMARAALSKTEAIAVIGYSFPQNDLHTQALMRVDAGSKGAAKHLKYLIIVNPDRACRQRIRSTLSARIAATTRVVSFDRLSDFAKFNI
jgi:hypothetical protein